MGKADTIYYAMPSKVMTYVSLDYEEPIQNNRNNRFIERNAGQIQRKELEHLTAEEYLSRFRKKGKGMP